MQKFLLIFSSVVFIILTIFILLVEVFPKKINESLYYTFKPKHPWESSGDTLYLSKVKADPNFLEKYGIVNDESLKYKYSNKNHDEAIFKIYTNNSYSESENPKLNFASYYDDFQKISLDLYDFHQWREISFSIVDTIIYNNSYRDTLKHYKNNKTLALIHTETHYVINKLPKGKYRFRTSIFDHELYAIFTVTDSIKAHWDFEPEQILDSCRITAVVYPMIDTKWYYSTIGVNPIFNWNYKVKKNGQWGKSIYVRNVSECGTGIDYSFTENKNRIVFNDDNLLHSELLAGYDWYLRKNKMTAPTIDLEDYWFGKPFDPNFLESDSYKIFKDQLLGDSVAVQLTFFVSPLCWSRYNYQEVYSKYYTFNSKEVYEHFKKAIKKESERRIKPNVY